MSDQDELLKKITAYEDNELSAEEKEAFEKALTTDKELARTWQLSQEVDKAIGNPKALEMEALLQGMGNEFATKYSGEQKKTGTIAKARVRPLYQLAIAASFALLVSIGWWQWQQLNPLDTQALYATVYEPYTAVNTTRSTNLALTNLLEEGQKNYQTRDYGTAIQQLSTVLTNKDLAQEDMLTAQFYKGLAHLGNNQLDLAQMDLMTVLKREGHIYTQQAQWYLALIALKNGDVAQTKEWLNQVLTTAGTGKYAKKAEALLKQLT